MAANDPPKPTRRLAPVHPLTLTLALLAATSAAAVPLGLRLIFGTPWGDTVGPHTVAALRARAPGDDSWNPMLRAIRCAGEERGGRLYRKVFFEERIKFQYPPSALLALYPTLHSGLSSAAALRGLSLVFLYANAWFAFLIFAHQVGWRGLPEDASAAWNRALAALVWLVLELTFYPVVKAYTLGQIQVWINAGFALLLWCWLRGWKGAAGLLLGAVCLIKPHYGIILLWGLARRQWRFMLCACGAGLVGLTFSVSLFGWGNHLDYLSVVSFIGKHGEAFYPNQSVNGLLNRLLFNGDNLEWGPHSFAPYHPAAYYGTLAGTLGLLWVAFFGPARTGEKGSALDLALVALAATIASPVAWEHHYGVLLPIYALLFPRLAREKSSRRWALPLLGLSYLLAGNFYLAANRLAASRLNVVQSYLLAGGLLVLALLYHARRSPVISRQ
jgi:hypothetical protein